MTTQKQDSFLKENLLGMSDSQLGRAIGLTKGQVRHRRQALGLNRSNAFNGELMAKGFDGENWSHGWLKTEDASIFIRNEEGIISYEEMREQLLADMRKYSPKYPKLKRKAIKDSHLLVVDPADIHIGKLALLAETGGEYNINIAKQRCLEGVQGLLDKAQGFPLEKIVLVIGNDIIHIDGSTRSTTGGTAQDTDGQWWQMFLEAKNLYVQVVEMLMQVADVEVIFCPSNHDFATGFMLADTLSSWFHKSGNVTFNCDIIHRKYLEYGLNMLAFDHGDGCKVNDTKDLMADEQPQMWGRTRFRYSYKHHLHHKHKINYTSAKDYIGVTVQYLRSPSGADAWHKKKGYISPKAVEGFIHHKTQGQLASFCHYFL